LQSLYRGIIQEVCSVLLGYQLVRTLASLVPSASEEPVEKGKKGNCTSDSDTVETVSSNGSNKDSVHVTGTSTGTGTFPVTKSNIDGRHIISTGA
jgi:hypothetical protein